MQSLDTERSSDVTKGILVEEVNCGFEGMVTAKEVTTFGTRGK